MSFLCHISRNDHDNILFFLVYSDGEVVIGHVTSWLCFSQLYDLPANCGIIIACILPTLHTSSHPPFLFPLSTVILFPPSTPLPIVHSKSYPPFNLTPPPGIIYISSFNYFNPSIITLHSFHSSHKHSL